MVINIFDAKSFIVMYKKGVINELWTDHKISTSQSNDPYLFTCYSEISIFRITLGKENWFELWEGLLNQGWTEMYGFWLVKEG